MEQFLQQVRRRAVTPSTASRTPAAPTSTTPYVRSQRARRRTRDLMEAVSRLDTTTDDKAKRDLMNFIEDCYEASEGGVPIALFSRCYLGAPYLDHVCDFSGTILQHFKGNQRVPAQYALARAMVRSDAYEFIEIYSDGSAIPVRADGSPVV